ncbi:hypothetical protein AAFN60_19220 [Roseibacillus persicicus]|uniref:hypothetical protein n=1 Tax=Roseibacillus persicicus TaxID=454148 RepID=UPI00398B3E1F
MSSLWFLRAAIQEQMPIMVIDKNTAYIDFTQSFEEATDLHLVQAEMATQALLNRHAGGPDSLVVLQKLYGKDAYPKAQQLIREEKSEFAIKQIQQKSHILTNRVLQLRNDSVTAEVTGQLIRTGVFADEVFVELLEFTLNLNFVRNPKLRENGRYPSVVVDFELKTQPVVK